jgi:hypothetical protein
MDLCHFLTIISRRVAGIHSQDRLCSHINPYTTTQQCRSIAMNMPIAQTQMLIKRQCNAMQPIPYVPSFVVSSLYAGHASLVYRRVGCLRLRHVAHTRRRATDGHARLQVVDEVRDEGDEKEEDEDNEEDDDVALHDGGMKGAREVSREASGREGGWL